MQTTKRQVQLFKEKISKLQRKFREKGPGAEGIELEVGADLVRKYAETLGRFVLNLLDILVFILL